MDKSQPIRRRKTRGNSVPVEKISITLLPGTKKRIEDMLPFSASMSAWIQDAINIKLEELRRHG